MNKRNVDFQLAKGEIHVWFIWLDRWNDQSGIFKGFLSPEEIHRSERYAVPGLGNDFITQKGLLRLLLSEYLDQNPANITFSSTKTGKPFIKGENLNFNISHSCDLFVCGISPDLALGLDIQYVYPITPLDRMIKKVCCETEIQLLDAVPSSELLDHFFTIWAAKEAVLKASGTGFNQSPNQFSIYRACENGYSLKYESSQLELTNKDWTIRELNISPGYKSVIASNGRIKELKIKQYSPKLSRYYPKPENSNN